MMVHIEAFGLVFHLDLSRKGHDDDSPPFDTPYPMALYPEPTVGFSAPEHLQDSVGVVGK